MHQVLLDKFSTFLDHLRFSAENLTKFWMSYIDLVAIMLDLIRATREGNWMMHMTAMRSLIPWCFGYDHLNYSRYLPIYYAHMSKLPKDHPLVFDEFCHGGFSVQLSSSNPFGRIPVDQTIEETVNKDTKTPGGIKCFSTNFQAVTKHYLTADARSTRIKQLSDKNLFGIIIFLSQTRNLNMQDVLKYPLGPIPYELAIGDGSIRKNNKSSLGKEIQNNLSCNNIVNLH